MHKQEIDSIIIIIITIIKLMTSGNAFHADGPA